jgi:uncharacterized protein
MATTSAADERILTLDIIRGIAVMGIFSVNVVTFSMPENVYFTPIAYGEATGASLWVWAINFLLIDGKMRGLFTLLFGASTLLVIQRAKAAGLSPASIHYRRMAWLLVFGLLHYYLIWFGDILTLYALVGMVAFRFRNGSIRFLLASGLFFLAVDMATMLYAAHNFASLAAAAQAPGATAEAVAALRDNFGTFLAPEPKKLAETIAVNSGGYGPLLHERITTGLYMPLLQLAIGWAETLGSILIGMAALKSGFLSGGWDSSRYRRIAIAGIGIGAIGYAALGWRSFHAGFDGPILFADFFAWTLPFRLAMMLGYAALIILAARSGWSLLPRIAAVGRAAFSNYLGTSILAMLFFHGLGLFGKLDRFETWLAVPAMWLLMLLWSKPWLDRYRYAPFEWAWRSLARWAPQPMRRREVVA